MAIVVEIPHAISRYSDEETQVLLAGSTVGEVLAALWERFPKLKTRVLNREGNLHAYLLLFRNDEKLPRVNINEHPLSAGDRLEIVALAEGG
ncbi:MAG: MoaD/ThiS family protein [Planctomycetaceae bacterium]|nr:MoaD/ThiS family protein [Planctomycetaceae bacterium]